MTPVGVHPIWLVDPYEPKPALHSQYPTCLQSALLLPSCLNGEDTATNECVTEGVLWDTDLPGLTAKEVSSWGSLLDSSWFPLSPFQLLPTFHGLNPVASPSLAHFPYNACCAFDVGRQFG